MSAFKVEQEVQVGFTTLTHNGSLANADESTTVATAAQVPGLAVRSAVGIDFAEPRPGSKTLGVDVGVGLGPFNLGLRINSAIDREGLQVTGIRVGGGIGTPGPVVSPSLRDTDCSRHTQCSRTP